MNFEKKSVFISYRTESGWELANLVENYLSSRNISVFFDKKGIRGGQEWADVLKANIDQCKVFVPILYGNSHECKETPEKTDWLWWEIEFALSHENVVVLPFIADNFVRPKNLPEKYEKLLNRIFDKNGENKVSQNTCIAQLNKLYKDIRSYISVDNRIDSEIYSDPDNHQEELKEALRINNEENKITREKDFEKASEITGNYEKLYVLDLGCGDGSKSEDLFYSKNRLVKLVGVDICKQYIDAATKRTMLKSNRFKFYQYDLRKPGAAQFLEKIVEDDLPEYQKFNIIYISKLLLHLAEPYRIIQMAKKVLSKDGTLIICDEDDALNLYYPDTVGWIEEFNRLWKEGHNNGNRLTGRQIYAYLEKAGFSADNINFQNILVPITNELSYDERVEVFDYMYHELLNDFEKKNETEYQLFYFESINWLQTCYKDLKKAFGNVQFNTNSHMIITAKNS